MLDIVHPAVMEYIDSLHQGEDELVLLEMEALAREKDFPIIGRSAGAFLELMALSSKAKNIFEFGSGFGYSAWWFARAVGPFGRVVCSDLDSNNVQLAKDFLSRADRWQQMEYHQSRAQDVFAQEQGDFDLVFCDADKGEYPEIWEMVRKRLKSGGLYIADNCLWYGRVAEDKVTDDVVEGWTEAIKEQNRLIAEDPDFSFFINPVRDGLIVARKK